MKDLLLSKEDEWIYRCKIYTNSRNYPSIVISNTYIQVHRVVMRALLNIELPKHLVVDHINNNKWDNRRENLHLISPQDNQFKWRVANGSSKYLRVYLDKRYNIWRARLSPKGKNSVLVGYSESEEEAATMADIWTVRLLPPTAKLNFPELLPYYIEEAKKLQTILPWQRLC